MFQHAFKALPAFTLAIMAAFGTMPALAHHEPSVVVFGDSLSDTGNVFAVTGQLNVPPYGELDPFRIPDFPYAISAGRFTNGPTWIEDLALRVGAWQSVRAALRTYRPGKNYSYGAARAGAPLVPNDARDLTEQVTAYLADVNGSADGDVIVLFIGANDVADAVRALAVDPTGATSIGGLLAGIGSVNANLAALVAAGARDFVILNVPNVALVPALNPPLAPPGLAGIATCWTVLFDQGTPLPSVCPQLPPGLPGLDDIVAALTTQPDVNVKLIDTFTFINQIAAEPGRYGIANMKDTCVTPNVAPYQCMRPSRYFFWDGIHPTQVVHQLLAKEVLRQLEVDAYAR
jgi:outer membrane lipase/esterase